MNSTTPRRTAPGIASVGHAAFAAVMIFFGVLGVIKGGFTVIWEPVPNGLPARQALAYLSTAVSLVSGVGLFWKRTAALAARILWAFLVLWLLLLSIPSVFLLPLVPGTWSCGRTMVMTAAAWILFAWFATDWDRRRFGFAVGDKGMRIARMLYGLGLIPFGIAHFIYPQPTAVLVPSWLPWHMFWAYFTGATFIVAGVAVVLCVFGRLATALSVLQMGLFGLLVWVPLIAAGSLSAFQWGEVVTTVALIAAGWVVADSYRGTPWLAARTRTGL